MQAVITMVANDYVILKCYFLLSLGTVGVSCRTQTSVNVQETVLVLKSGEVVQETGHQKPD